MISNESSNNEIYQPVYPGAELTVLESYLLLFQYSLVPRLHPFLRSDGGSLSSKHFCPSSGIFRPRKTVNIVITTFNYLFYYLCLFKTKIANEQVIHNFVKEFVYFEHESERSSGYNFSQE